MRLNLKRLTTGERLCGCCGIALLGSMFFLNWFGVRAPGAIASPGPGFERNAFQAFTVIDLVLFAAAVSAIGLVVLMLRHVDRGLQVARVVLVLGVLAFVLIAIRLIATPDLVLATANLSGGAQDLRVTDLGGATVTPEAGAWLGLLAAAGLTVGGYLTVNERAWPTRPARIPPPSWQAS
jgi:hypothetical protein